MVTSASVTGRHLFHIKNAFHVRHSLFGHSIRCLSAAFSFKDNHNLKIKAQPLSSKRILNRVLKATAGNDAISSTSDDEDGVSLGTMKLPLDTDLARFETLLFQVRSMNVIDVFGHLSYAVPNI